MELNSKNKLWTEVFNKLRTEQKFTPFYPSKCNGRIEEFHKFLKATIAKQLENHVKWDDLVCPCNSEGPMVHLKIDTTGKGIKKSIHQHCTRYNFFPTESSGIAPFFLMFGREAPIKHNLLESESPKYLVTEDSMINVELMSKLYLVVAHNLNEAMKAGDGSNKKKSTKKHRPTQNR